MEQIGEKGRACGMHGANWQARMEPVACMEQIGEQGESCGPVAFMEQIGEQRAMNRVCKEQQMGKHGIEQTEMGESQPREMKCNT